VVTTASDDERCPCGRCPGDDGDERPERGDRRPVEQAVVEVVLDPARRPERRHEHRLGDDPGARARPQAIAVGDTEDAAEVAGAEDLVPHRLRPAQHEHERGDDRRPPPPCVREPVGAEPDRGGDGGRCDRCHQVHVAEVRLHEDARHEGRPRHRPPHAGGKDRGKPEETPEREQQRRLLARVDEERAAHRRLEDDGRQHRPDDPDRSQHTSRRQPYTHHGGKVDQPCAEDRAPVGRHLRERSEEVELQRPEVVHRRRRARRAGRKGADKRVVSGEHVA
jgi:hypothetical protein